MNLPKLLLEPENPRDKESGSMGEARGARKFKNCTGYVDFVKLDGHTPPHHPKGDKLFQKRKFSAQ